MNVQLQTSNEIRFAKIETTLGTYLMREENDDSQSERKKRVITGLWRQGQRHFPSYSEAEIFSTKAPDLLAETEKQLNAYLLGEHQDFDLPLQLKGTVFQRSVWEQLLQIPYASTRSYLEIAQAIGQGKAVRAVATAIGKNPISLVVPCHRVVGVKGTLNGYAGGIEVKARLLEIEAQAKKLGKI